MASAGKAAAAIAMIALLLGGFAFVRASAPEVQQAAETSSNPSACPATSFLTQVIENLTGGLQFNCQQPKYSDLAPTSLPFNASSGLTQYWSLNEAQGTTAYDYSGGRLNAGTLHASPTWVQGKFGSGLSFSSASSQYVSFANDCMGLNGARQLTVTFLLYISANPAATERMVSAYTSGTNGAFLLGLDSTGAPYIDFILSGGDYIFNSGSISTGAWHMMAITWNNSNTFYTVYLDGVSIGTRNSIPQGATFACASGASDIGGAGFGSYFDGKLDDVRVYNYAFDDRLALQAYHYVPGV